MDSGPQTVLARRESFGQERTKAGLGPEAQPRLIAASLFSKERTPTVNLLGNYKKRLKRMVKMPLQFRKGLLICRICSFLKMPWDLLKKTFMLFHVYALKGLWVNFSVQEELLRMIS